MAQETVLDAPARGSQPRTRFGRPWAASISRAFRWLLTPAGGAALLGFGFIVISIVWLGLDHRPPNGDSGRHLGFVLYFRENLLAGHELVPFRFEPITGAVYPPLVYVIGMLEMLVFGRGVDGPVIALNVLFVPLLVVACFRVGTIAFNRWAGLLAVMFALAAPMTISQFHLFMLDMPVTAMVAAAVWLMLESERFSRRGPTIAAGVVAGLGMLTKQPFLFFVAPFAVILILRGGWRQWRNLALFALVAGVIALPWYIQHFHSLQRVANEATAQATSGGGGGAATDHNPFGTEDTRNSLDNYLWYFWNFVNLQYLLPLTILFAIGTVSAAVGWMRRRSRDDYGPELIVGAVGGLLITSVFFGFQDSRYSFPALIFVAVLGTGWIARSAKPVRIVGSLLVAAILVVNTVSVNLGLLGQPHLTVGTVTPADSADAAQPHTLRLFSNFGYVVGPPEDGGRIMERMESAKRDGVRAIGYEPIAPFYLNPSGLGVFAQILGLKNPPAYHPKQWGRSGILLVYRPVRPGQPKPCARFEDGGGLYIFRGDPGRLTPGGTDLRGARLDHLYCPPA